MVIGDVDIGLKSATIPTITQVTMVDCCIYMLLLIVFTKFFMSMKELVILVMTEDVDLGLKIPSTITFTIA